MELVKLSNENEELFVIPICGHGFTKGGTRIVQ